MNSKFLGLLVLFFASFTASAQYFDWSKHASLVGSSNHGHSLGTSLATDPYGNCFVAGLVYKKVVIGNDTIGDSTGAAFLAKYSQQGQLLWMKKLKGLYDSIQVRADAQGNCCIMGAVSGTAIIGADTITNTPNHGCIVVAKLNGQGATQWLREFKFSQAYPWGIFDMGPNGDVAVSGHFYDTLRIGQTVLTYSNSQLPTYPQYLVQFDANGNLGSANLYPQYQSYANDIEVDGAGDVYLTGIYSDTVRFGSFSLTGDTSNSWVEPRNSYLLKVSSQGVPAWLASLGKTWFHEWRLELDGNSNPTVSGLCSINTDTLVLGNLPPMTFTQNSLVLARFSSVGQALWAVQHAGFLDIKDMAVSTQGEIYLYGQYYYPLTLGNIQLPTTTGGAFLAKFNPAGASLWATPLPVHSGLYRITGLAIDSTGGYLTGKEYVSSPTPGFSTTQFYLHHFRSETNYITGRVFLDFNSNGSPDSLENGWTGALLERMPGNHFFVTDSTGEFTATAGIGTSTISIPNPPLYHTVIPASRSVTFPAYGLTDSANYFALQPVPGQQDLRVTLTHLGIARPGFPYNYQVTYQNVGTVPLSGQLTLEYDSVLAFINSTVPVTSQAGNTLTWNAGTIAPYEKHSFTAEFGVPVSAPVGYKVISTAGLQPLAGDLTPMDNTSLDSVRVRNSSDPNDKIVSHTSLTPEQAERAPWLTYTVRFQNTGTAPASIVRIDDQLSGNLNRGTLEVLDASHKYQWTITPTGKVTFHFPNIHLPDSGANEAASHGFIKYRVRPKAALTDGQEILNTAGIYFDYNAPVITNTVRTAIEWPPYLGENSLVLSLSPNPNQGVFEYTIKNTAAGPMGVQVFSGTGRLVRKLSFNTRENRSITREMNLSDLSSGLYLLRITQGSRQTTQQVIIEN